MIKKLIGTGAALATVGAAAFFVLTQPATLDASVLPSHVPDVQNGETMFWAGGCASCHAAPGAKGAAKLRLTGGVELKTPFGTFRAPNISPDPTHGIGGWSNTDFINAMVNGVSPDGRHYYPAFPYANYRRMPLKDLLDLKAFLATLEPMDQASPEHGLGFPFNIRRGLGLWKQLFLTGERFSYDPTRPGASDRGRYLVQGPGHCGACHTPRNLFGGEITEQFLGGAKAFEGAAKTDDKGKKGSVAGGIPNITPHKDGIGGWSAIDIAYALETGFDPDFDSFGGSMVAVQENMAKLSPQDRAAIAAYLKSIPALASR